MPDSPDHLWSIVLAGGDGKRLQRLPVVDFSRTILMQRPPRLAVLRVKDVYWSDWGNPAQVKQDLARFGCAPAIRNGAEREPAAAGLCAR